MFFINATQADNWMKSSGTAARYDMAARSHVGPKMDVIRWNEWRPKMENSFVENGKLRSVSDLSSA